MVPPNKRFNAAKGYYELIDAKRPRNDNSERISDPDFHPYSARVRLALEFAFYFSAVTIAISVDNKQKMMAGETAADRRTRHRCMCPTADRPNTKDHNFSFGAQNKFTPMGYLILHSKECDSGQGAIPVCKDPKGREHIAFPRTGPFHIRFRAQLFQKSTIELHVNDLTHICKDYVAEGRSILILIADNGPDWNWNCSANCLFMGRLFKELELDAVISISYAPGQSALNMIEHGWSFLTTRLAGTYLSACLPGEDVPPLNQTGISHEAKVAKLCTVLDNAMAKTCSVLEGTKWDSFPLQVSYQGAAESSKPFSDYADIKDSFKTASNYRQSEQSQREYQFFLAHADRRNDCLLIKKCSKESCDYCSTHPVHSVEAMTF